ncbi:hypothetical protein INP51_08650 [Blautia liquoris]|uniref:DUF7601 domain-containing protein n=1 Tax=Blautia liquoris TaxID=2779518 RepID=A0A7M2RDT1_9FIRM|nr:hypothetical protein [Blautia liquoris]QOV18124.1 hypothetical protein INP51_08650 [Blautia liquoris]
MKKKNTFKALLSLTMAAVLSLGTVVTAFAGPPTPPATDGDNVKILKEVQMDNTLSIPSTGFTFQFQFTAKDFNGQAAAPTVVNDTSPMPTVTNTSITVNSTDKYNSASTENLDVYRKESTNKIFDNVTWPAPGAYTYTVKEVRPSGYTNAAAGETMTDDETEYEVTAYVKNNDTYTGFVIESIGVRTPGTTGTEGKIVVTPGLGTNQFKFTNIFSQMAGGTDPLLNASLTVSKKVADTAHGDKGQYFPFTITPTAAGTETSSTRYNAYLIEEDSNGTKTVIPWDPNNNPENYSTPADTNGEYIRVDPNDTNPMKIRLKHNQSVAFTGMGVGSKYVAEEDGVAHYVANIELLTNGVSGSVSGTLATAANTQIRTLGTATNSAAFTNTYDETTAITPTGIQANDMPFLMMIVLAAVALGGYVVIRFRKKNSAEN